MEDLPVEQLVPELLTSLTPSALTTSATSLPWPSSTSASRSLAMISSARKPFRGIDLPPNALQALTSAWTDPAGEGHVGEQVVKDALRIAVLPQILGDLLLADFLLRL